MYLGRIEKKYLKLCSCLFQWPHGLIDNEQQVNCLILIWEVRRKVGRVNSDEAECRAASPVALDGKGKCIGKAEGGHLIELIQ